MSFLGGLRWHPADPCLDRAFPDRHCQNPHGIALLLALGIRSPVSRSKLFVIWIPSRAVLRWHLAIPCLGRAFPGRLHQKPHGIALLLALGIRSPVSRSRLFVIRIPSRAVLRWHLAIPCLGRAFPDRHCQISQKNQEF